MIVSVNWLKKYTAIDLSIDELVTLIGSRLVEIEQVIDLGKKYEGVVIAKVVECVPVEGSDHLNVTKIDDGGVVKDVARDEKGYVQVVCGAPNVRAGLTVAWLPPASVVPETFGDAEPFVLGARELRGVMSNGMLASAKELDLWDDHTGIIELEDEHQPGASFTAAYELDDYLLDIENKSLTHRPDTFGIIGFAREVAGVAGQPFTTLNTLLIGGDRLPQKSGNVETPRVTIDDPELSSRYQAVVLSDVDCKVPLSPMVTQTYLARVGVKPHSAVVDVTNYMMMASGQPLHAFDYDKLKAVNNGVIDIHVRAGRKDEKLVLLDGREITLSENDIVIANGDVAVALAGAMGGRDTEIDETTTNVLLESATFNLYNLRNTQMRHGIFSEAITRFTKGQPAELTAPVLASAVEMMSNAAGAVVASEVADTYPNHQEQQPVSTTVDALNAALGSDFTTDDVVRTLKNVEFDVSTDDQGVIIATPPYWRADIHIAEDLNEEVGRLNGFETIAPTLPRRDFTAVQPDWFDYIRAKIRHTLVRAGANEVLTYSFVHGDLLKKAGQDPANSYRIVNSISPDLQYYRQSLTPSLLSLVHPNIKAGYDSFALFELNKTHVKSDGLDDDKLPFEQDHLALVVARKNEKGAAYYEARRQLEYLGSQLGLSFTFQPINEPVTSVNAAPFEYRRSAYVFASTGEPVGIVGEFKKSVAANFKLPEYAAGFVVAPAELARLSAAVKPSYVPLSRYPSTERDICFQVKSDTTYADVKSAVENGLSSSGLQTEVSPLDFYQSEQSTDTKNITLRVRLTSHEKTLTADDAAEVMNKMADSVISSLGATVI